MLDLLLSFMLMRTQVTAIRLRKRASIALEVG